MPAPVLALLLAACGGGGGGGGSSVAPTTSASNPTPQPVTSPPPPPPPPPPPENYAETIFENFPANRGIYDLTPNTAAANEPNINYELPSGDGDNDLFRVSDDGRIWWRTSPDFENPQDADGDNVYEIRVTHSRNNAGQTELTITVDDINREMTAAEWVAQTDEADYFRFNFPNVRSILPNNDFVQYILGGFAYALPANGPLILTWSLVLPNSPLDGFIASSLPPATTSQAMLDKARSHLERAFDEFERVANLKFIEVADGTDKVGDIRILWGEVAGHRATDILDGSSHITIGSASSTYSTYVHEIGHVLGLSHPFNPIGAGFPHKEEFRYSELSIMSYNQNWDREGLQEADIAALQFLYGAPGTNFDGLQDALTDIGITPIIL